MLIDEYLKDFDFKEYDELKVKGTPEEIYTSMLKTSLNKSLLIKLLFCLRGMPNPLGQIKDMDKLGFIKLDEIINEELLFGRVTTSPTFSDCNPDISSRQFKLNSSRGIIKAVINFRTVQIEEDETLVSTETRVLCSDKKTRNKFSIYWFFISPFSRLIRHLMLKQIREQCSSVQL